MAGVGRKLTLKEFGAALVAKASAMPQLVRQYLDAAGILCESELKRDMAEGRSPDGTPYKPLAHPRPDGSSLPLRDKGLLMASLVGGANHIRRVAERGIAIGTNLAYAAVHQFGATIAPVVGRFLAIPLTAAAKKAGGPRNYPGDLAGRYGKSGGLLIDKATQQKQYALTAGPVVIPARPFVGFSVALKSKLKALAWQIFGSGKAA
jgi:phage gpG-like protein